jgi:putative membrane protein
MRTVKDYLILMLKGMAMGAADVVPGVSGGTIAFITNIYEELIDSLNRLDVKAIKILFKEGVKPFWQHINGNFFLFLLSGIGISIISLAKLITFLLATYPVLVWSFFFGLVFASIFFVGKQVSNWHFPTVISFIAGALIAYIITDIPPMQSPESSWFVFVSGAIAICAMILPGISGSFILLLLGSYETILNAVKNFEIKTILLFAFGCVVGLLSFSKLLKWMFAKNHDLTVALLSGFLLGSLNKIWPWKETLSTRINSHGETVPFIQKNISPFVAENPQVAAAIALAVGGALLLFILEMVGNIKKSH